jgi:UPF0755 protein
MKRFRILISMILILSTGSVVLYSWASSPPGGSRRVVFEVRRGWGARTIAETLQDSGLVRSSLYVIWRAGRLGVASRFEAGEYALDSSMDPDSILLMIASGDVIPVPTNWVTLPEGLTLDQSLEALSASLDIPPDSLREAASESPLLDSLGIPDLEGYLFPETYEFADTLGAAEVIDRIVRTGLERWDPSWDTELPAIGLTRGQAVILASIVEKEAKLDEERPLVSGVFLARLRRGMRLESCATVQYSLGEVRERLSLADLRVESPYNTYLHAGLPPGPICSPGTASLSAAANPDTTEGYLYFVSREDGTGGHLFATSLTGHLANIRSVRSGGTH